VKTLINAQFEFFEAGRQALSPPPQRVEPLTQRRVVCAHHLEKYGKLGSWLRQRQAK
jgi:hypothetical protein